jgi:hypothetical protein
MKSYVWTYNKNKKPVGREYDRYYLIKNEKQMDDLIKKFIEIDAVTIPAALTFPVMLELVSGFAPQFKIANKTAIRKELNKLQKMLGE